MKINLDGKRALVCGCTQGIGRAIAETFAASGASIVALARNEKEVQGVLASLKGDGHEYLIADFHRFDHIQRLEEKIRSIPIDILVNNAGGPPPGTLEQAKWEEFELAFGMHLKVSHHLSQWVLEGMKKRKFGRILNIISTSVKIPIPGLGVSNTVRGAMASWAKTLANEVGPYGVTVNSILPGFVNTARLDGLIDDQANKGATTREIVIEQFKKSVPMRRFAEAEELAGLATFLCSDYAGYMTGLAIPVDGGRTGTI